MSRPPFNPDLVQPPPERAPSSVKAPLTVSRVTALVKRALEAALPTALHVVGEISNFTRHSSGHLYFTLKDDRSELSCVMWRSAAARLRFEPTDGLEVVATGTIEVYERAGRYQLYVRRLDPRGTGALELAFQQLREKLAGEGLFDPKRKKGIPAFPSRIAVVTSPTGAAIADVLRTIARRYPCVDVLVYPVRVQGEGAAGEVAAAIEMVNTQAASLGGVDLMIVGRGGGSLEDLWAFNEEVVARAIFASSIPVISAVGHEVDVTIADLAADVRAATPTAAAEIAVPLLSDVLTDLAGYEARLTRSVAARANLADARFTGLLRRAGFADPAGAVVRRAQIVDDLATRLERLLVDRLRAVRADLDRCEPMLQRIAPHRAMLRAVVALQQAAHRLELAPAAFVHAARRRIDALRKQVLDVSPERRVAAHQARMAHLRSHWTSSIRHRVLLARAAVEAKEDILGAMDYKSVLGRGFSITRLKNGRSVLRKTDVLRDGDRVVTELTDGEFESRVVNLNQLELFDE